MSQEAKIDCNGLIRFQPFVLDSGQGALTCDDERIALARKPFLALTILLESQGQIVSKAQLIQTIWPDAFVEESSLTQCIFLLRKSIGKTSDDVEIIETVPKRGYRIAVPVEVRKPVLPSEEMSHQTQVDIPLLVVNERTVPPATVEPSRTGGRAVNRWIFRAAAILAVAGGALYGMSLGGLMWERPAVFSAVRLTNDGAYKERLISLLSDGSRIYFSEDVDAALYLAEVSVGGGETSRRPAPRPIDAALAYSAKTNEILFGPMWEQAIEHRFAAMSLNGGTLRALGELSGHAAAWSPDGTQVVLAKGLGIYVANADGESSHEIAHLPEAPYWPRWSPDGTRIRFSMQRWTQNVGLWEVKIDGSNLHPLFTDETWARQACCGEWSPDGRYYIFVKDEARRSSLWVVRDHRYAWQSAEPMPLAEGPADFWRAPLVSADGKHIYALGEQARGELVRFDPRAKRFEPYLDGLSTDTISFSRDGQWMAWTAYPEGTLWRSRIDGSERLRLTEPGGVARFPRWSPDGSQIVYISPAADSSWKIYRVPSAGGQPNALIADNTNQGAASWSPDGQQIAFAHIVNFGVNTQKQQQIQVLDLKTHALSAVPGSVGLWRARWSPTGDYISAVSADNHHLLLFDRRTSHWSELTDVGTNDCIWSHDGQYIFFDSPWEPNVYRLHVKSKTLEKYASLKGIRRTGFFGWSLNLAPDDTPVLLREAGIHELYSLGVRLP